MAKLNKKGELAKAEDGTPVIVNDKKQAYGAGEGIIAVWQMCDGTKTEEEISTALAEKTATPRENIEKTVSEIVTKLREVELIA